MKQDQTKEYWEKRLSQSYSLGGVGFNGIGKNYNRWIYRARSRRFRSIVKQYIPSRSIACMDIASGTGFYLSQLSALGFTNVSGSDFTEKAFRSLTEEFRLLRILQFDITSSTKVYSPVFGLVTCMDMLFHIVEDSAYENAISNLSSLLEQGGYLIITENFTPRYRNRGHICDRTRETVLEVCKRNNLSLVGVFPLFIFLNSPVQSSGKLPGKISKLRVSLLRKLEKANLSLISGGIGLLLYSLDWVLLHLGFKDKGSSMIVLRKEYHTALNKCL